MNIFGSRKFISPKKTFQLCTSCFRMNKDGSNSNIQLVLLLLVIIDNYVTPHYRFCVATHSKSYVSIPHYKIFVATHCNFYVATPHYMTYARIFYVVTQRYDSQFTPRRS
jgi:hypothetical protein